MTQIASDRGGSAIDSAQLIDLLGRASVVLEAARPCRARCDILLLVAPFPFIVWGRRNSPLDSPPHHGRVRQLIRNDHRVGSRPCLVSTPSTGIGAVDGTRGAIDTMA